MEIVSKRSDFITIADDVAIVTEKLTVSEREIFALSLPTEDNLKIKDTDLLTLAETISNTVNIRLGLKPREKPDEIIFLNTIERDCSKFPGLTSGEILKALEMGLDGVFNPDKDIFFNSSVFVKWIRAYIEDTKKPVISKHSQLVHQNKGPEHVPTDAERKKLIADVANMYASQRRKNPEHRVTGASPLYIALVENKIYEMPVEERFQVFKDTTALNPNRTKEEIIALCQNTAYNRFIGELVDFEMMLNDECETIDYIS
jgi:hypothetical protein